jgi:hypothetical protein
MKNTFIPAKSNLSRTSYEVLMICLKKESIKYLDKPIYWMVDPIRNKRVEKIQREILEPRRSMVFAINEIRLPTIRKEDLWQYTKFAIETLDYRKTEKSQRDREEFENERMESEDFSQNDQPTMESRFCHPVIVDAMPEFVPIDMGKPVYEHHIEAHLNSLKPYKKEVLYPNKNYKFYMNEVPMPKIVPPGTKTTYKIGKTPNYLDKKELGREKQKEWQDKVNVEMEKVLLGSLLLNQGVARWYKAKEPNKVRDYYAYNSPDKKLSQLIKLSTEMSDHHAHVNPNKRLNMKKTKSIKLKQNEIKAEYSAHIPENEDLKCVSENFSLRLLYYSFYLAGMPKRITYLEQVNMRLGLLRYTKDLHFRQYKGTKVRIKRKERYFLDQLFNFTIPKSKCEEPPVELKIEDDDDSGISDEEGVEVVDTFEEKPQKPAEIETTLALPLDPREEMSKKLLKKFGLDKPVKRKKYKSSYAEYSDY